MFCAKWTLNLKDLEIIPAQSQDFYDSYNKFMISGDLKIFGKLLARTTLLEMVKEVPGDIIECGVFKGTGIFSFLKLKRYLCPNSTKKVIGFDFFDTQALLSDLEGQDKEAMTALFEGRDFNHTSSYEEILSNIIFSSGFEPHEYELIKGDISVTSKQFAEERPGAKISLLFIDLDLRKPTFDVLSSLWARVSRGGIVVFDEYAHHQWSESQGVDEFFSEINDVQVRSLNFSAPSAYVVKP
jgi:hypothetical protein